MVCKNFWDFHTESNGLEKEEKNQKTKYGEKKDTDKRDGKKRNGNCFKSKRNTREYRARTESGCSRARTKAKYIEQKPEKVERIKSEENQKRKEDKHSPISIFFKKLKKILGIPRIILRKVKKTWLTVHGICDKISEIRIFLESEVFLNAKTLLLGEVKKLGLHILPRKVRGEIEFGFDDPSLTGRILAVAGICYPLYGNNIKITPYFDRKILEGELKVKGRIRGIVLLKSALKVGFNQEVREIWKNFKG